MLTNAIILSLAAFATAKKSEPLINDNTTLLAARYNNNMRKFEKDFMKAFGSQVQMQQAMNPDSLKNMAKAMIGGGNMPGLALTITDEVGTPVGDVSQMQYGSIMLTIYQMPVSINSSNCDVYASVKVPRTRKGGDKASDSELRSILSNGKKQCQNHIAALDGYAVERIVPGCWTSMTSAQRLACLQPTIDKRMAYTNALIARVAAEELASGLPTDAVNAKVYQKDLKNQANLAITEDFFLNTLMLPFSIPQLRYANKLGRELRANATMQRGNVTTQ
jgi:hypothetical protein